MATQYKTRILIYDIETSYIVGGTWDMWNTNVATILADWQILCFAYKWLDEKKVHIVSADQFKDYKPGLFNVNDKPVVEKLHELFSEADVVVAHNGNSFDQKKVQARMMVHKLPPPLPYAQVDTKVAIKQVAAHTSNKLSELAKSLELAHKMDAGGIETWTGCMTGDKKAWAHMKRYNKQDVITLEELYLEIRPWMKTHPALNVLESRPESCPKCGSSRMNAGMKYRATNTNLYQYYRCMECSGMAKARIPEPKQALERMRYVN